MKIIIDQMNIYIYMLYNGTVYRVHAKILSIFDSINWIPITMTAITINALIIARFLVEPCLYTIFNRLIIFDDWERIANTTTSRVHCFEVQLLVNELSLNTCQLVFQTCTDYHLSIWCVQCQLCIYRIHLISPDGIWSFPCWSLDQVDYRAKLILLI